MSDNPLEVGKKYALLWKSPTAISRDLQAQNEKDAARIAQQAQTQLLNMGYNWNQLTLTWIKPEKSNNPFSPKRYLK